MKKVSVYWLDITVYENNNTVSPTPAYTEGNLYLLTDDFVVIKDPETLLIKPEGAINHPKDKPRYYYIPKSLITEINYL